MRAEPRLSIIIPTLNEEDIIEGLLQELLSIPDVQVIVSDGGSSDDTCAICARYPVLLVESSRGRGPQFNDGAASASGEILLFMHADSHIEPSLANEIYQAVDLGNKWGCCTLTFDNRALIFRLIAWQSNLRARLFSMCYGDQGIYCTRELFFEAGQYPPTIFLEDIGLSDRLRRRSPAWMLKGTIETSSRRFLKHGVFRTIIKMQIAKILYRLGEKPEKIMRWYDGHPGIEV
ncbi:MAG: glycosyltransferase family 2 protein [Syntrophomonadaceae bacterium]|nr:glycosyltransferase family 2 protein [Syntrophomonadaceae bacterium]